MPLVGDHETLLTFQLQEGETGLVIDQSQEVLLIGLTGSTPPRGIGVKRLLLINIPVKATREVDFDQFIPSARQELGGGVQVLVVP